MNPWLETVLAVALGIGGVLAGRWLSKKPSPWWVIGYAVPLAVVVLFLVTARFPRLAFLPALHWAVMGRQRYLVGAAIIPMLLMTPLPRLPRPRDRSAVMALMLASVFAFAVWPCLSAALKNKELAALKTKIDADGVCRQNTDYTCGPAAAVTALRRLGLSIGEGELARLALTSPAAGTPPDLLAEALQNRFGDLDLTAELRPFADVDELAQAGLVLVVVKFGFMTDHWITVLKVTDQGVEIADPNVGLVHEPKEDFIRRWRGFGIVLKRAGR